MTTPRLLSNRYELGDTLGYGGMSEVHRGHDVRLGREVAVKILRADLARDPQFQERFRREAQNAAALNHPAIVAVYDTGEANTEYGPLPYIVMEYVEGRTLRDIVKTEGPMSQKRAMEVMADVCAALDFSHRHGIVHRDVKPANIMITRNGAVKVMDFGIARAIHDGQAAMTQTAAVIGTAQYLSPEQARGEQVDARSDVYAAGCVLYELVTGEPPFTGDSPVAVAYQHVREDPHPPSSVNPAVSAELDAVVLKALAKGPANRYQSSAEMRSDLVRTLSGQRPSAPAVLSDDERTQAMGASQRQDQAYDDYDQYDPEEERRRRRKRGLLIAAGVILAVAAASAIMSLLGVFDDDNPAVAVPQVRGLSQIDATAKLKEAGFKEPKAEFVSCHPQGNNQPPTCTNDDIGRVVNVNPAAGQEVSTGTQIVLTIGQAPKQVDVPDLKGKSRSEAEQALQEKGLLLDQAVEQTPVDDPNQYDKVQKQDPAPPSKLEEGSSVKITVGAMQEVVEVTDYRGKSYDTAKAALEKAGFQVQRTDVDSEEEEGVVVDQNPNGGSQPKNSTIKLSVSNGSKQEIDMPSLTGKTEEQAKQALAQAGWEGDYTTQADSSSNPSDQGKISKTDPAAGSKITKNQSITLYIVEKSVSSEPSSPTGLPIPGIGG